MEVTYSASVIESPNEIAASVPSTRKMLLGGIIG